MNYELEISQEDLELLFCIFIDGTTTPKNAHQLALETKMRVLLSVIHTHGLPMVIDIFEQKLTVVPETII